MYTVTTWIREHSCASMPVVIWEYTHGTCKYASCYLRIHVECIQLLCEFENTYVQVCQLLSWDVQICQLLFENTHGTIKWIITSMPVCYSQTTMGGIVASVCKSAYYWPIGYMGCRLYQNSLLAGIKKAWGFMKVVDIYVNHSRNMVWITEDINFRDATTVGIYEVVDIYVNFIGRHCVNCSGYLHGLIILYIPPMYTLVL